MKKIILAAVAVSVLALPGMAFAQAQVVSMEGHKMCPHSELEWHNSPTKVMLMVKESTKGESSQFCFPSLSDGLKELGEQFDSPVFDQVVVLDFETYGADEQVYIDGTQAYYLVGAQVGDKASGKLNIVAFNSKPAAKSKSRDIGGKLAKFNDLPGLVEAYIAGELQANGNRAVTPAATPECNS